MTLQEFADRLAEVASDRKAADIFRNKLLSPFSKSQFEEIPPRKTVACVLRLYLVTVMHEQDEDWGECAAFKDIYECRVCANAIAQVCVKGYMKPVNAREFGINLPLSDEEAEEIIELVRKTVSDVIQSGA